MSTCQLRSWGEGFLVDVRESKARGTWKSPKQGERVGDWIWPADWTRPWEEMGEREQERRERTDREHVSKMAGFSRNQNLDDGVGGTNLLGWRGLGWGVGPQSQDSETETLQALLRESRSQHELSNANSATVSHLSPVPFRPFNRFNSDGGQALRGAKWP